MKKNIVKKAKKITKKKYPKITVALLKEKGACSSQVDLLEKHAGKKGYIEPTDRNAIKFASVFDFYWAAQHLLNEEDLAEYKKAYPPIEAEYQKSYAPIEAEYQKSYAPILAEYEKAHAPIVAEYEKAIAPIKAEYQKAIAPIDAEYEKAIAPILAKYKKAHALIDAEYDKAVALAFVRLYRKGM